MRFNKQELRESVINRLNQLSEAYTDNPLGRNPVKNEDRFSLTNFLTTWRINKDPNWDFNMKRPELGEGIEDGDNYYKAIYQQLCQQFQPSALNLMKAAYFLDESALEEASEETTPVIIVDTSDNDNTDTDAFIASLQHALETKSDIGLILADDHEIVLDEETIKKLLNDKDLILQLLGNLNSIYDVATILSLDIDADEVASEIEESEEDDDFEIQSALLESELTERANKILETMLENDITKIALANAAATNTASSDKNIKEIGKMKIIRRAIRGGRVVRNLVRSNKKGWKIVSGKVVKMTPKEKRNRKFAALFKANRKRAAKETISLFRREKSDRLRARLGI